MHSHMMLEYTEQTMFTQVRSYLYAVFLSAFTHVSVNHINKSHSYRKDRGKDHPTTAHEGPEGKKRYSSTPSSTSSLEWVGGQRHVPAALPPGNVTPRVTIKVLYTMMRDLTL